MFCMKCGNSLPDNAAFCDKCGEKTNLTGTSSNYSGASQYYSRPQPNRPIKGVVLNIASVIITFTGIMVSLFSTYFEVSVKGFNRINAGVSLFGINDFLEAVNTYLDSSVAKSFSVVQFIFWVCLIDIIVAVVLLIVRLTKFNGIFYNSYSSYVPITPAIMTIICLISFNNTNEYIKASVTFFMYFLVILFIANIVLERVGESFNSAEIYKAKLRSSSLPEGYWICKYCCWENKSSDLRCQNCWKKK